ncbi:MAG: hypothetical protein K0S74_862 [Chlamydiales bacterium]|jgi:hypothetical protein|nr:hypothetical protein [Chlamydiales bacterium]
MNVQHSNDFISYFAYEWNKLNIPKCRDEAQAVQITLEEAIRSPGNVKKNFEHKLNHLHKNYSDWKKKGWPANQKPKYFVVGIVNKKAKETFHNIASQHRNHEISCRSGY